MQYKKTEKYSQIARWESREAIKGAGRKEGPNRQPLIHASTVLSDHCSKAIMVQAPKFRHEGPELSENNPASI